MKEELSELERLQILVDGANDKYMLQIFMREAAALHDDQRAGPFFYEIIQRAGRPRLRLRQLPRALREHRASSRTAGKKS